MRPLLSNSLQNKRILTSAVLVLTCLLIGSGAYAAVSGNLIYSGHARIQGSIDTSEVHFLVEQNEVSAKGGSIGTMLLSSEDGKMNQVIRIEATFEDVEDILTFYFRLRNVGNYAATVSGLSTDGGKLPYMHGTYRNAAGVTISPGETIPAEESGAYTMSINFKDMNVDDIELGRPYQFDIKLPYERVH